MKRVIIKGGKGSSFGAAKNPWLIYLRNYHKVKKNISFDEYKKQYKRKSPKLKRQIAHVKNNKMSQIQLEALLNQMEHAHNEASEIANRQNEYYQERLTVPGLKKKIIEAVEKVQENPKNNTEAKIEKALVKEIEKIVIPELTQGQIKKIKEDEEDKKNQEEYDRLLKEEKQNNVRFEQPTFLKQLEKLEEKGNEIQDKLDLLHNKKSAKDRELKKMLKEELTEIDRKIEYLYTYKHL